jgi:phosphatidylglycerol:prolipoprotein diacylglycerol transferase
VRVHPTPVYESLAYFAIFAFLWRLRLRPAPDGTVFSWYLVLSGTARFLVEFVRTNPQVAWGLTEAQLTSAAIVAIGASAFVAQHTWRTAAA